MADYPRVTHPCAAPTTRYCYPVISARLACLIHAASVRSEPESNSPLKNVSLNLESSTAAEFYVLDLILKLLVPLELTQVSPKGALKTYRTFQFSKSIECFHSKIHPGLLFLPNRRGQELSSFEKRVKENRRFFLCR